ncbi:hypothetical protein SDRG_01508 [Saprolegnia diclina VS20]|uniref:Cytochrome P450 n=1 Tax=Saprolegnia diclina (strain VS20) TaxID=1156394 RepID=T0R3L6_SAPDV|nr:hypothetical protein SDRG_01508 [Saprolegnia diclina VS20]EQC41546.1 hypothetical protein SDRG_01508 [Saprolegnia diclina VS20]|eukprot:XP_008605260.1 hypothetical protein SDRG_01508 [Saprolegnia diclina VS20]
MVVTKDPAIYKAALGLSHQKYFDRAPSITAVMTYFLPRSLGAVTSHDWSRIRRTLQRGMAMQSFDNFPSLVASCIQKLDRATLSKQPASDNKDVLTVVPEDFFPSLTFDVFHRLMYQWDPNTVAGDSMDLLRAALHLSEMFAERVMLPFPLLWKLPLPRNYEADAALHDLHAKVVELVNARRQYLASLDELPHPTLLDYLLGALEDETLSNDEVYDNVTGFFIAAFDTTSNALSLLFNNLALNPDVQAKLRAALATSFPGGPDAIARATSKDLDGCDYLTMTLDESMRLTPPIHSAVRKCVQACEIHGVRFEVGDELFMHSHGAAMDPDNYAGMDDLECFRPERFQDTTFDKPVSLVFGYGQRMCLGRHLAIAEMKAICAYVVSSYGLSRPADGPPLKLDSTLTIGTKVGYGTMHWRRL